MADRQYLVHFPDGTREVMASSVEFQDNGVAILYDERGHRAGVVPPTEGVTIVDPLGNPVTHTAADDRTTELSVQYVHPDREDWQGPVQLTRKVQLVDLVQLLDLLDRLEQ